MYKRGRYYLSFIRLYKLDFLSCYVEVDHVSFGPMSPHQMSHIHLYILFGFASPKRERKKDNERGRGE